MILFHDSVLNDGFPLSIGCHIALAVLHLQVISKLSTTHVAIGPLRTLLTVKVQMDMNSQIKRTQHIP